MDLQPTNGDENALVTPSSPEPSRECVNEPYPTPTCSDFQRSGDLTSLLQPVHIVGRDIASIQPIHARRSYLHSFPPSSLAC